MRQEEWKLIVNGVDRSGTREPLDPVKDKYFLVNFDQDYTETRNFAEENPEKVQELQSLHDNWFEEIDDWRLYILNNGAKGINIKFKLQ